jgi:hypothetical protein
MSMNRTFEIQFNPEFDLLLERTVDIPVQLV